MIKDLVLVSEYPAAGWRGTKSLPSAAILRVKGK